LKKIVKIFPVYGLFFIIVILAIAFSPDEPNYILDNPYPKWLKSGEYFTDQTSGICFIQKKDNTRYFLLADDIGKIHLLEIDDNENFFLRSVNFSEKVNQKLSKFEKWDFEEIVYDKFENRVYISIEGNGENYLSEAGLYELFFKNNDIFTYYIEDIKKIEFKNNNKIFEFVRSNIGFEGVCVDENNFYLGLEGFEVGKLFADSTYIYIIDKSNLVLKKRVSTKSLKIGTICGLTSVKNNVIMGVDRNKQKIFKIVFDSKFNIRKFDEFDITIQIPKYKKLQYVAAIESITIDNNGSIYCVDDPWKSFYIPPKIILSKLDNETQNNFQNYIPIIYKFNKK